MAGRRRSASGLPQAGPELAGSTELTGGKRSLLLLVCWLTSLLLAFYGGQSFQQFGTPAGLVVAATSQQVVVQAPAVALPAPGASEPCEARGDAVAQPGPAAPPSVGVSPWASPPYTRANTTYSPMVPLVATRRDSKRIGFIVEEQHRNYGAPKEFTRKKDDPACRAWRPFAPTWPCFWGMTVVGSEASWDGNKFVCGFEGYQLDPCVVYSFGSRLNFVFEHAMHEINPNCEIHIFDPTVQPFNSEDKFVIDRDQRFHFHFLGLGGSKGNKPGVGPVDTLSNIARSLGHTSIDVLKVDVEGSEYEAVKDWRHSGMPSVSQILMEVHDVPKMVQAYRELLDNLHHMDFRIVHSELNSPCCTEIVAVQRTFVPGVRQYPTPSGGPTAALQPGQGATSLHTVLRTTEELAERLRSTLRSHPELPWQTLAVNSNFACRWTEEYLDRWASCGLRELPTHQPCTVVAMNSIYYGQAFRRGVLAAAPHCEVQIVQVRKPPLWREHKECGTYLSPDLSGPAQCPDAVPCCPASGNWCGNTKAHCHSGTDYGEVRRGSNPLFSKLEEGDGAVDWVLAPKLPQQKSLTLLQASGPSVAKAMDWLAAGGRASQLILGVDVESVLDLSHRLEEYGYRAFRSIYVGGEAAGSSSLRAGQEEGKVKPHVQLSMVAKDFDPSQR